MPFRRRRKVTRNLYPRGAAVGARVMSAFARSIRMQHHRAGMAHDVRIRLRQHFDVVPDRHQAVDERAIEAQYVGRTIQTSDTEIIEVRLQEIDNEERVVLVDRVE